MLPRLPFFLAVGFALGLSGVAQAQDKSARPNIVFVLADDLGWGDLGCFGHPTMQTPNLDKFAKQGMLFTQCYAASAVCSPSRSAILTGRTPYRNGVFNWIPEGSEVHLRTSEITLATLLKRIGYTTCHVGKWHLNGLFNSPKQPQPNDHGYDWWLATQNNAAPSHKNPNNFARNGKAVGPMEGYSAPLIVDQAIHWLQKERDKTKPFFITVWFHEPHLPIETDPKFQSLYPDLVKSDADKAQHHGNISQMDSAFGKLMKTLDDMKLSDNTIVIFTSDNGPEGNGLKGRTRGSTGGLRGRKRSVYEGGIRVPGIVRWPGKVPPGSKSDQPIIGSDFFTTLCTIAGAKIPTDRPIDGASILPAFAGKPIERKTPMYWRCAIATEEFKIAMRQGEFVILANEALSKFELYNLKDDVKQTTDLKDTAKDRFAVMKATLVQLNTEIEKEGPDWWRKFKKEPKKKAKTAGAPGSPLLHAADGSVLPEGGDLGAGQADAIARAARKVKLTIAHRGASSDHPENTLASFRGAIAAGASATEIDIRTTKDGALVCLHDADVKRTTDGKGLARDLTLAELLKLDAGRWFAPKFRGERIPTLSQALMLCRDKIDVLLDLQEPGEDYAQRVTAAVRKFGQPKRTILGIRNVEHARLFRKLLPEARQIGLIPKAADIAAFAEAGVDIIRIWPKWLNDATLVPQVRKLGKALHLNGTMGSEEEIRMLLKYEPESLSSDDPARLVRTLAAIAGKK